VVPDDGASRWVRTAAEILLRPLPVLLHGQIGHDARGDAIVVRVALTLVARRAAIRADADSWARVEEMRGAAVQLLRALMQRCQVGEYPEGRAMRGDDHIRALDDEIVDRHDGQAALRAPAAEQLPVRAVIEGDVDPRLGTAVEETPAVWIGTDNACELVCR